MKRFLLFCVFAMLLTVVGCSGKVSVKGTVKYDDGAPLTRGILFFQNAGGTRAYQGAIKSDGSFNLGEIKDGDGIPPGTYSAWIANANYTDEGDENYRGKPKDVVIIHRKYEAPGSSDLTFSITDRTTKIELVVDRP